MAIIGAVTDDFTGTASAGVLVARTGAKTGLFFDADAVKEFEDADRLDAVYVSSNSRHLSPCVAYEEVKKTTKELQNMGIKYLSKKIDTTLRGGIGFEIDAMLECMGDDSIAVMVTAMPPSRRICVGGFSIIDGVILTETPVAYDVKTPVRDCYVPSIIDRQSKYRVATIDIKEVLSGTENLKEKMNRAKKHEGARIIIVDAITMEHIDTIAKACVELGWNILAVDPGPFTMKMAYHRGVINETRTNDYSEVSVSRNKTALLMVGSANSSTKKQVEILCADNEKNICISAEPEKLLEGGDKATEEVNRVSEKVISLLNSDEKPQAIVVETALHGSVLNLEDEDRKHEYERGTCSRLINDGLARITQNVLENVDRDQIAGLLLTGGDTMESICRKIGVSCIQALDNIVAQVDVGRIIGKYEGLPVVVKGGFCGYETVGIDIVERLFLEASK